MYLRHGRLSARAARQLRSLRSFESPTRAALNWFGDGCVAEVGEDGRPTATTERSPHKGAISSALRLIPP